MGRRNTKQRQWLQENGYLNGSSELLTEGKAEWKRKYQREYQKARRKRMKYVVVSLTDEEADQLRNQAKEHHQTLTTYLREAALAYDQNRYLIPDNEQLIQLQEELAFIRYNLDDIKTMASRSFGSEKEQQFDLALDRIAYLDNYIQTALLHPPLTAYPS